MFNNLFKVRSQSQSRKKQKEKSEIISLSIIVNNYHPLVTMIDELILDPQLKYWVLLPISIVMVIVGLVRSNITSLLGPDVKLEDAKKNREKYVMNP